MSAPVYSHVVYDIVEECSFGPYLELFARTPRPGWVQWGNEIEQEQRDPKNPSLAERKAPAGLVLA